MPFAIVLYFFEDQQIPIKKIQQEIAARKISDFAQKFSVGPHITLAIFAELLCDKCERELKTLTRQTQSLNLSMSHIGIFNNDDAVVFLAPSVLSKLLDFHLLLHEKLMGVGVNPWENYLPGNWVPHCTLAMDLKKNRVPEAVRISQNLSLPLQLSTKSLGVVEFEPMTAFFTFDFQD